MFKIKKQILPGLFSRSSTTISRSRLGILLLPRPSLFMVNPHSHALTYQLGPSSRRSTDLLRCRTSERCIYYWNVYKLNGPLLYLRYIDRFFFLHQVLSNTGSEVSYKTRQMLLLHYYLWHLTNTVCIRIEDTLSPRIPSSSLKVCKSGPLVRRILKYLGSTG